MPIQVAVVTTTRADYGILYSVLQELCRNPLTDLRLIVSGTHLLAEYGMTVETIERHGFPIWGKIAIASVTDDSPGARVLASAAIASGVSAMFGEEKPDWLVLLGDRFEILAVAHTALLHGVPIAHIHGGEITEGAIDDAVRHAVTKLASLHFVAAPEFAQRVRQMGEADERVIVSGAPALDNLDDVELMTQTELSKELGLDVTSEFAILTFHPATRSPDDPAAQVAPTLDALDSFESLPVVATGSNMDLGSHEIDSLVRKWVAARPRTRRYMNTLGQQRYYSALASGGVVIGNSSSGIIEAPSFGTPTVNVGSRQHGRPRASSVIDVANAVDDIVAGLAKALTPEFRAVCASTENPYLSGSAARTIVSTIARMDPKTALTKPFIDRFAP